LNKPKIAVLIDWYLPGTKAGGPVRSVYSLVNLLKPYFEFYIVTSDKDLGCTESYKEITSDKLFEKEGIYYYFFSSEKLKSKNMLGVIKQIDPALIYLNSFWSFHFSISIVNIKNNFALEIPILLAPRGMLGKGALGLKSLKKRLFLLLAKTLGWYKVILFHATQKQEEADIKAKFPYAKIQIAPNINSSPVLSNTSVKASKKIRLFFLSRVSEIKNLHFALELLREIPPQYAIEYDIFGNIEHESYWAICKSIIASLPAHVQVSYKGEIPFHEVQHVISSYHFLLMPTLNENYGHSIVESLLSGCPVIISDQTPWTDLEENNAGFSIPLNDRKKFVEAIRYAADMDQSAFSKKSKAANDYICKKIDLNLVLTQYKTLFNDCIKNRPFNI